MSPVKIPLEPCLQAMVLTSPFTATKRISGAALAGALEEGAEADGKGHVAFDAQAPAHERAGAIELAGEDKDVVGGARAQREVRILEFAASGLRRSVLDLQPPAAAAISAEVDLDRLVHRAGLGAVQVARHR